MSRYENLDIQHEDLCEANDRQDEKKVAKMEEYYQRIVAYLHPVNAEDTALWKRYLNHLQELSDNPFRMEEGHGDTLYFHFTWKSDGFGTAMYVPKEVKFWEQMQNIIRNREENLTHAVQGYLPSWSYDEEGARVWMLYESAKAMSGRVKIEQEHCAAVVGGLEKCDKECGGDGINPYSNYWR